MLFQIYLETLILKMFTNKLVKCVRILPSVFNPPSSARALSAPPSLSEATEAVEHIGDAEQRLNASLSLQSVDMDSFPPPKLDKNGVSKSSFFKLDFCCCCN